MRRLASFEAVAAGSVHCELSVRGNRAFIAGEYPLALVREVTSYFVEGYSFSPAYRRWIKDPLTGQKRRAWDGRCHLFDLKSSSLPAGLAPVVVRALRDADPQARVHLVREDDGPAAANDPAGFQLQGISFGQGKFDYQLEAAKAAIGAKKCILKIATNGGKTEIACAITNYLKLHTLFVVPGVDLLHQTRKRFSKRLGIVIENIGMIGDGKFTVGNWITVATVDSLHSRKDDPEVQRLMSTHWQVLFVDECHTAGSDTFYEVLDTLGAFYRFGLSGTPLDRTDGADLRLIAQTGEVAYEVSNKLLIEREISVPVEIHMKKIDNLKSISKHYKTAAKEAVVQNDALNGDVEQWTAAQIAAGLQVVVLVKEIEHGKQIEKRIRQHVPETKFLHGDEPTDVRERALEDYTAGTLRCLIGTRILYQGIDTPAIDALVFADLGKSRIAVLQALGRGLRARPGKTKLIVRDYANFCHKWMLEHSLARLKTYKRENCFTLLQGS